MESYGALAAVYDPLMRGVEYGAWADYLLSFLKEAGGTPLVAECACGTGELTVRLQRAGCRVTGLDVSETMLALAQEKARKQGLSIPFVRQDMRRLILHRPMDAVIAACDGVNYLASPSDVRAFFAAAYRALRPGGLLLFDVSSRYKLQTVLGCNTFGERAPECVYLWQNRYDDVSRLCEMELTFFVPRGSLYERFDERHVQRAHSERELRNWLGREGFTGIEAFAAFTREPPSAQAERIQFVARRP